jgi:hypothetical protein
VRTDGSVRAALQGSTGALQICGDPAPVPKDPARVSAAAVHRSTDRSRLRTDEVRRCSKETHLLCGISDSSGAEVHFLARATRDWSGSGRLPAGRMRRFVLAAHLCGATPSTTEGFLEAARRLRLHFVGRLCSQRRQCRNVITYSRHCAYHCRPASAARASPPQPRVREVNYADEVVNVINSAHLIKWRHRISSTTPCVFRLPAG